MSTASAGLPVPPDLQRSAVRDRDEWVASGVAAVDLLSRSLGKESLAGVEVLDVGCGTKIVKTLLDGGLPVGRYVGIDVESLVIDWLDANVDDPRFEFHHFEARNELYNPTGPPLDEFDELPVGPDRFDLICLFSVFTHLAPDDFVAMLRLTRQHVKDDGLLVFSIFLNDPDEVTPWSMAIDAGLASDDPAVRAEAEAAHARCVEAWRSGYWEGYPDEPLRQSHYERAFALRLMEGSGWEVSAVNPPERYIQHQIVCRPQTR